MRAIARRRAANAVPAKKRKCWRPSKRNAVMRLALMKRPTTEDVRKMDSHGCPLCGADSSNLHLEERAPRRCQPAALDWLGISSPRWIRGTKEIVCHECGTSYTGGHLHNWNLAKYQRRFADFGKTRFPLPFEKRKKSVMETLIDQLPPAKRHLVNLKKRNAIVKKPKRMQRLENWARSKQGLPPVYDD